ncbi:MAG TPA: glycosyltransferase family 4 protein [bacterium]|nr:glycosyltransferase family 4 protein [bacterium]HPN45221.1 glycosyltransferase family 4 protein [bacterium]
MKSRRIKILLVQSRICVGGPAVHTEMIARYLPKERYQVTLVGGGLKKGEMSKFDDIREKGVDIRIIGDMKRNISVFGDLVSVYKTWQLIKQIKPDIVDTHTAKAGAVGRIAARLAGVPIVIHTFHGHVFEEFFSNLKSWLFVYIEKMFALLANRIIAISPMQFYDLAKKYKIAPVKKFVIVKLGLELDRFLNIEKNNRLKETLGIPAQDILIGVIGRMVPTKNHLMVIRVLKNLHDAGFKAHLYIAGDGEERYKLEKLRDELNLQPWIHFPGWVVDIEHIYAGIDLLAQTSTTEGTPFTVIEAMAAGVPVAATNVGGVADMLLDDENGLLCRSRDDREMAEKIKSLFKQPEQINKMTQRARKFVIDNYSYKRLISDLDQLYTRLFSQYYQQERC